MKWDQNVVAQKNNLKKKVTNNFKKSNKYIGKQVRKG